MNSVRKKRKEVHLDNKEKRERDLQVTKAA